MPADDDFAYPDALPPAFGLGPAHRRAAGLNPANRFEHLRTFVLGEALDEAVRERADEMAASAVASASPPTAPAGAPPTAAPLRPRTVPLEVFRDRTRTIINQVAPEADMPFGFTLNPYRGCEHGCIYCYARTHHEYLGFSCGLDFETRIMAKTEAPELLLRELALPKWKGEPIVMSAITDVYQPVEKELRLTRRCLEIMEACGQPVATMTKNTLALRDLDLWQSLARRRAGQVVVTLVTLDPKLAGLLEPRASPPMARLRVIREMARAGVPVGVNIAPVIPGLTDKEIPAILEAAREAGATSAIWILLRLPYQLKALFEDWLRRHFPERADHVLSLLRQSYGGKLYDASDGLRGNGDGPYVAQIGQMFRVFAAKHGFHPHGLGALSSAHFRKPGRNGEMSLF